MAGKTADYSLGAVIERGKREILSDIEAGTVPATVANFAELHDYVDANHYGGAFEDDAPDHNSDLWTQAQEAWDAWLRAGRKLPLTPAQRSTIMSALVVAAQVYRDHAIDPAVVDSPRLIAQFRKQHNDALAVIAMLEDANIMEVG